MRPVQSPANRLLWLRDPGSALVVLAVVASFLSGLYVDLGRVSVRPERVVTVAMALLALIRWRASLLGALRSPAMVAVGLFVLWHVAVTLARAPDVAKSSTILGWLALDALLLACLLAWPDRRRLVLDAGYASALVACLVSLFVWTAATLWSWRFGVREVQDYGGFASYLTAYEPNILGGLFALWGLVALGDPRPLGTPTRLPDWVRIGAFALAPLAILSTNTRAALLGFVVGAVLLALLQRGAALKGVLAAGAVSATVLAAGALLLPEALSATVDKFSRLMDFDQGTGLVRLNAWRQAVDDMAPIDWVVGLGTNTFGQRNLDLTRPEVPTPGYLANGSLQVLYDSGLVGFALLVAAVVFAVRSCSRASRSTALAVLAAYFVASLSTSSLWFSSTWILLGVAFMRGDHLRGIDARLQSDAAARSRP